MVLKIAFAFILWITLGSCANLKLCKNKDLKGECINVSVNKDQCVKLTKQKWANSLSTGSGCFRLYDKDKCEGKSKFVGPNTPNQNDLKKIGFDNKIVSVSECFSEDKCSNRGKRQTNNGCRWANDELTIGFLPWLQRDRNNLKPPVVYFQRNQNGRTEVMEALIEKKHLKTGTPTDQNARNYATSSGRPDDDAGHILAARLGGSGTDLRNIFPQSKNFNRGVWAREVEDWVARVVETKGKARFTVNLVYNNNQDKRPTLLVYRILGPNDEFLHQGDILNP